jgi:hypothetical protein
MQCVQARTDVSRKAFQGFRRSGLPGKLRAACSCNSRSCVSIQHMTSTVRGRSHYQERRRLDDLALSPLPSQCERDHDGIPGAILVAPRYENADEFCIPEGYAWGVKEQDSTP